MTDEKIMKAYFHIIDHEHWPTDDLIYIQYDLARSMQKGDIIFWPFQAYILQLEIHDRHFDFQHRTLALICNLKDWHVSPEWMESHEGEICDEKIIIKQSKMNDEDFTISDLKTDEK